MNSTIKIPANGSALATAPGKVLSVLKCALQVLVSLDGGASENATTGTVIDRTDRGGFRFLNFINGNSVAVEVTFSVGDKPAAFAPADNSQSNAATVAVGNLGIAAGTGAAGGNPACDAANYLQITNAMALVIPSENAGRRRQSIVFSVKRTSAYSLEVADADGKGFMTIDAGERIELVTDSGFIVSGDGGTCVCKIGQIVLADN